MTLVLVPAALLLMIAGSTVFLRSPQRAAGFVLAVYVADAAWVGIPPLQLGLHISPQDVLFILLLTATGLRYVLGMAHMERRRFILLALLGLVLLSIGRGIAAYGATQAGVESRGFFWLFAGMVYFSSFAYGEERMAAIIRLWQKAAWALILLAVFRWTAAGLHLALAATWTDPYASPMRVLDASAAMFLCVAFFLSMTLKAGRCGARWQQNQYYVLGPALILLQHRTVWVVATLGIIWMLRRNGPLMRRSFLLIAAGLGAGAVLAASTFGLHALLESLQQSATSGNTFIWRVAGWYQLVLLRTADTAHLLFGDAFGTGFARVLGVTEVIVSPHNFYVETYLRMGIVGLLLLVWFFASQLRVCSKLSAEHGLAFAGLNPRIWTLFLVFQITYSITYNPGYEQSMIFGMIVGLTALHNRGYSPAGESMASAPFLQEPS